MDAPKRFLVAVAVIGSMLTGMAHEVRAQIPQLTQAQARQALSSYVTAPDSALSVNAVIDVNYDGHTSYLFYGDQGGAYSIDAATQEKSIKYAGISGGSTTPANPVPVQQLQQTALNFVAQHFPGYQPGLLQMIAGAIDRQYDADEYYVSFGLPTPSGAELPVHCLLILEEDSGKIKIYEETNIPVIVSITPAVSQQQAIQIGQNWISQNISNDPADGEFNTDLGGSPPVKLLVFVDPGLNETLEYTIKYATIVLMIDAQTGAVIGSDSYASIPSRPRAAPSRAAKDRERFLDVLLSAAGHSLNHAAIQTHNQIYVWAPHLKWIGVHNVRHRARLILSMGNKQLSLTCAKAAVGDTRSAWERQDGIYVPLSALVALTNRIQARPDQKAIIIARVTNK